MCDVNGPFKLCTCSEKINKKKPYWVLERVSSNLKDMIPTMIGMFPSEYEFNIDLIINQLNNKKPFDFNYHPKQKDTLTLNFESDTFHVIYTNGKWRDFYDYVGLNESDKQNKSEGIIQ